jgi:hypothetical protein
MIEQSSIPAEWRTAADETAKALSVARAIERRQYPEGDAPAGLVAALVVSASLARVRDGCLAVADEVQSAREPVLTDRVAGIEQELYRLAEVASSVYGRLTDPTRKPGQF